MSMHTRAQLHLRSDPGWVYQSACTGGSRGLQNPGCCSRFSWREAKLGMQEPCVPAHLVALLVQVQRGHQLLRARVHKVHAPVAVAGDDELRAARTGTTSLCPGSGHL